MKLINIYFIIFILILSGCSKVRESAGVTRKSIDELQVIENPPLVIPPEFNIMPPDQLNQNKIDNIEKELAKEILFGLEDNTALKQKDLSTMNQILSKTEALETSSLIRNEIDEQYANEIKTNDIFQLNWENEIKVLDAVKESNRIRNQKFEGKAISNGDVLTKKEIIKVKKKKRFIFF